MSDTIMVVQKASALGTTVKHHDLQRFINRMQRKLETKEMLYPEGRNHRFTEPVHLRLQGPR